MTAKREANWRRGLRGAGAGLCLGVVMAGGMAAGTEDAKKESEKKVVLGEAEEKALRVFVEKLTAAKRRLYEEGMKEMVKTLATEAGMDEAGRGRLEAGVGPAVEAAMKGWEERAYGWLAPFVDRSANAAREMARWPVEQIAKSPGVEGVTPPGEQAVWREHLKRELTAEQWGRWEERLRREEEELRTRTVEHAAFAAENQRPMMEGEMEFAVTDLSGTLGLAPERREKLKQLAGQAVTDALEAWKARAVATLEKMERERREAIINQGNGGLRLPDEVEVKPQDQEKWKQGLAELLSEEERKRVAETAEKRRERRVAASQRAILQVLDEHVGLTREQRAEVLPRLRAAAEKLTEQMRRYYNLDPYSVAAVLRGGETEGLRACLDGSQIGDLERLLNPPGRPEPDEAALEEARKAAPPGNEEELEALLSVELVRRHGGIEEAKRTEMRTHLEDLQRQTGLRPEQRRVLETTALGAVQDSLQLVRQQLGMWLRQSMAGAPAEGVRQRLVTLGTAGFGNEMAPQDTALWRSAVKRVLDAEQKSRWKAALEERDRELRETQLQLVMSELDQQLGLTGGQAAFFEGHLKRILQEYAPDLDEYNGARQWHLHAYSMLTPVMGVPEEEMKQRLSESQLAMWEEKSASQVRHYWEGVKRKHEARKKAEGEPKKIEGGGRRP